MVQSVEEDVGKQAVVGGDEAGVGRLKQDGAAVRTDAGVYDGDVDGVFGEVGMAVVQQE